MKTLSIFFSIVAIIFASLQGNAQSHSNNDSWIISKDVQKVSNRSWLQNQNSLTVRSIGIPQAVVSKGVNNLGKTTSINLSASNGNMISAGYPAWIISKGVARIGK